MFMSSFSGTVLVKMTSLLFKMADLLAGYGIISLLLLLCVCVCVCVCVWGGGGDFADVCQWGVISSIFSD